MYKHIFKRLFDIIIALFLITLLIVPFFIISIFIIIDSKGSVFYKQTRIGRKMKHFQIFKFRTMVNNADQIGGYSTQINDKRITKIGKFLRKTSIDELPQLINILFGEMSFIGPRPDVPQQKINYSPIEFENRHRVLPGLTGLAQSKCRHNISVKQRKTYDIYYNKNVSFFLDIKIIGWTINILKKESY